MLLDPRSNLPMYVGCAEQAAYRVAIHASKGIYNSTKLGSWLLLLKEQNLYPNFNVLEAGVGFTWAAAERKWIQHYKMLNPQLLNESLGGPGAAKVVSNSTRLKMSLAHTGVYHASGYKISERTKEAMKLGRERYWNEWKRSRTASAGDLASLRGKKA